MTKIKEIQQKERPYERAKRFGLQALSDQELLAIFLRSGTKGDSALCVANEILYGTNYLPEGLLRLQHMSLQELETIRGIGEVKAIQLQALGELARRMWKEKNKEGLSFENPDTIARYYMEEMRHKAQEILVLLMLNTKAQLLHEKVLFKGTVNASLVSPREIFVEALKAEAVFIILMHNHPSGDPCPSKEDQLITKRIEKCGNLVGIRLLDHIILGDGDYFSFAKQNLL